MSRLKKYGGLFLAAVALIGGYEGVRTVAYRDIVGVPTICFGETRGVKMGDTATMDQCNEMLGDGIIDFSTRLDKCLTAKVPDKPYMTFLSLAYNVGTGAICKSTLVKKANAGDIRGACNELPKWNRAGGKVVAGLTKRRLDEQRICLEGLQ